VATGPSSGQCVSPCGNGNSTTRKRLTKGRKAGEGACPKTRTPEPFESRAKDRTPACDVWAIFAPQQMKYSGRVNRRRVNDRLCCGTAGDPSPGFRAASHFEACLKAAAQCLANFPSSLASPLPGAEFFQSIGRWDRYFPCEKRIAMKCTESPEPSTIVDRNQVHRPFQITLQRRSPGPDFAPSGTGQQTMTTSDADLTTPPSQIYLCAMCSWLAQFAPERDRHAREIRPLLERDRR